MCNVTINDIPNEVLEIIFSMMPSVVDQINLCLVCQQWRHIILGLRHFHRKHLVRKRKARNKTLGASQNFTFDRHVYMRLPVAGSLNDWGNSNKKMIPTAISKTNRFNPIVIINEILNELCF